LIVAAFFLALRKWRQPDNAASLNALVCGIANQGTNFVLQTATNGECLFLLKRIMTAMKVALLNSVAVGEHEQSSFALGVTFVWLSQNARLEKLNFFSL